MANLKSGSTRVRVFRALKQFPNGLTVAQIREKCDMKPNSGHLPVILTEAREDKTIVGKPVHVNGEEGREVLVFTLTAAGRKWMDGEEFEKEAVRDGNVGGTWSKAHWASLKGQGKKPTAKAKAKAKATKTSPKKAPTPKRDEEPVEATAAAAE